MKPLDDKYITINKTCGACGGTLFYKRPPNRCVPCNRRFCRNLYHRNPLPQRERSIRSHYAHRAERIAKQRIKREGIRLEALYHYSGGVIKCACCSESQLCFMSIDHINGNGYEHRKNPKTLEICRWLKANNWPRGFQVLCFNCNIAKGRNEHCPCKAGTAKRLKNAY